MLDAFSLTNAPSAPRRRKQLNSLQAETEALSRLRPLFSENFCTHPPGTHNSIAGKSANGAAYRTRAAQTYPTEMNAALAKALVALFPATAALRDAGG
eukprot:1520640-Pleurochrysis_carterae.AAC.1